MIYEWRNADHTILSATNEDGHVVILEEGHPDWESASSREDVQPYNKPLDEILEHFKVLTDNLVESVAKSKGYNGAAHLASYVASTVPTWSSEATTFVVWRDNVWLTVFSLLTTLSEVPTDEFFLSQLPVIDWEGADNG